METITLTTEQMNRILNYLSDRPYREVVELIMMIHSEWEKQSNERNSFGVKIENEGNAK